MLRNRRYSALLSRPYPSSMLEQTESALAIGWLTKRSQRGDLMYRVAVLSTLEMGMSYTMFRRRDNDFAVLRRRPRKLVRRHVREHLGGSVALPTPASPTEIP